MQSTLLSRILPRFGRQQISQNNGMSTMSHLKKKPLPLGTMLKGDAGRTYRIDRILADRPKPLLSVYRASDESKTFIIKHMIPGEFEYQLDLQKQLSTCPNIRVVVDTIQELELFIYPFLTGDLLRLSQKSLSKDTRRSILRNALNGLAEMHDKLIIHNDIKANNILVDYEECPTNGQINVQNVQISDLEDTVILPPNKSIRGGMCGSAIWRSPESWCRARQKHSSDVFSFGIVMIYVMMDEMVFLLPSDQLEAKDSWRYVLPRHISFFADEDSLSGFLNHIGADNPYYEYLSSLASTFKSDNLWQPFDKWTDIESDLRNLIGKMTSIDPTRRITAREALQHPWFDQSE